MKNVPVPQTRDLYDLNDKDSPAKQYLRVRGLEAVLNCSGSDVI